MADYVDIMELRTSDDPDDSDDGHSLEECIHRGHAYTSMYSVSCDCDLLSLAVLSYRTALGLCPDPSPDHVRTKIGLADVLRLQFEERLTGEKDDGETYAEALGLAESAIRDMQMQPESSPDLYMEALRALGEVLLRRWHAGNELQRAVETLSELAVRAQELEDGMRPTALALYAIALCRLFEDQSKDVQHVELANGAVNRALVLVAEGDDVPYELSEAHSMARAAWFGITHDLGDIDESISAMRSLIDRIAPGHFRLHVYYSSLMSNYHQRYLVTGSPDDLDAQMVASDEARRRVSRSHPLWHQEQANYAEVLYRRFVAHGDLEDQKEAIAVARPVVESIMSAPPGRILNGDAIVMSLAEMLTDRYSQTGILELLDEAITLHWISLRRAPMPRKARNLRAMSAAYRSRFLAHGRLADLEQAVVLLDQGLECATGFEHMQVTYDLADVLIAIFNARKDAADLDRAISLLQTSLTSNWRQPQEHGRQQSMLGLALLLRASSTSSIEDIEECIQRQRRALDLVMVESFERFVCYFRLGLAEYQRFMIGHQTTGIDNSVAAFNRALCIMPLDHTARADYLLHLARSLIVLSDLQDSTATFLEALEALREAATHSVSWPADRYAAAVEWAKTAHQRGYLILAIEAYRLAISLLPQLASFGLEDELRVQHIGKQGLDIPQDAAACALELGEPQLAVELLEASRTLMWNSGQELRTDLARLREAAPDLASELAATHAALEFRPQVEGPETSNKEREVERRRLHRLASKRAELISQIRSCPGFEQFLLPPTFDSLKQAAAHGPVIILNSSTYRCDALLIRADEDITLIPLVGLRHDLVKKEAMVLQYCLRTATRDRKGLHFLETALQELLRRLWNFIGSPVCTALQNHLTTSRLPRVWWCPTGAMSFLPIHACGPHDGKHLGIADMFVSSYTPTLSALLRAQKPKLITAAISPSVLVISQPNAPGQLALPGAIHEVSMLQALFPQAGTFLVGPSATVSRVESLLPHYSWLHITSHGTQNSLNPLESAIALYDGPLKLSHLVQAYLPQAQFAFLSACHSAKGTEWIPDESMHLAAGLMFAGFRSVVATSWAIADKDGPLITKVFYNYLNGKGSPPLATDAAEALHMAVQTLRKSGVGAHRWVPFIHLGA